MKEKKRLYGLIGSVAPSLIAIIVGLLFGFVILLVSNPSQAVRGIGIILAGGFNGGAKGVGEVLYYATPVILTGLSVGFAFKTGLFNIGASGQLMVGAFTAIWVGVNVNLPAPWHWMLAVLCAALAGGVMVGAGRERVRSSHVGFLTGILMLVLLIPANWALLKAGANVRDMALPTVVMAARWGSAGYYIVIALMGLAVLTTLSATLTSLRDQLAGLGLNRAVSLTLSAASAALMSVCGFELLVNLVYPMLGWICAFALLSLLSYLPARK